jgi:Xaa-Pro dipeptidase
VDQDIYALAEPVIRRDEALAQADRSIRAEHRAHLRGESAGTPNCRWRHGFLDLGPVFDEWEADVGRTYVMGNDPERHHLCRDLPRIFDDLKQYFDDHRDVTGAELYAYAQQRAEAAGWLFGGAIAGHIVGEFPHARIPGDKDLYRISPSNPGRMRDPDALEQMRHWIIEVHLVDRARTFGGFYERLLQPADMA